MRESSFTVPSRTLLTHLSLSLMRPIKHAAAAWPNCFLSLLVTLIPEYGSSIILRHGQPLPSACPFLKWSLGCPKLSITSTHTMLSFVPHSFQGQQFIRSPFSSMGLRMSFSTPFTLITYHSGFTCSRLVYTISTRHSNVACNKFAVALHGLNWCHLHILLLNIEILFSSLYLPSTVYPCCQSVFIHRNDPFEPSTQFLYSMSGLKTRQHHVYLDGFTFVPHSSAAEISMEESTKEQMTSCVSCWRWITREEGLLMGGCIPNGESRIIHSRQYR